MNQVVRNLISSSSLLNSATYLLLILLILVFPTFAWSVDPPDPNYSQTLLESGPGWQRVETTGIIDDTQQPFSQQIYMIDDTQGVTNSPIPSILKDPLMEDIITSRGDNVYQSGFEENEASGKAGIAFAVNKQVADEIALSLAQGSPTPALLAMAESPDLGDEPPSPFKGNQPPGILGSCSDRNITKGKHFGYSTGISNTWNLGDGFSGTLALNGDANVNADGEIKIRLKRAKILFLCIPYGVRFEHARVWGSVHAAQEATLSGTLNYSNPTPWTWPIAKPYLFSINFMAGPLPVHIGFKLPITAGVDKNGFNASITGSLTYSGQGSIDGTIDYICTRDGCSGTSSLTTNNPTPGVFTAGISGRFRPSIYLQVALRGYLYAEDFAYAQVGVKPYLHGDLWGYYGNNCGDANADGSFETVDALTLDLDWQLYVTAQVDTFITKEWRKNLWNSSRWHIKFWDLIGSSALSPMLIGPATVPVNSTQTYKARMRTCWPYQDTVNYTLNWGDGASQPLSSSWTFGIPVPGSASHAWSQTGTPQLTLMALNDAHGRVFNESTSRSVTVEAGIPAGPNLALSAVASASSTYCNPNVYNWCYDPSRINDGNESTELGGLYSWSNATYPNPSEWVQLTWSAPVTFSRVELFSTAGYEIRDFVIQFRSNIWPYVWFDLNASPSFPTDNTATHVTYMFPPITKDRIRVLCKSGPLGAQQGYCRVNELEVY